MINDKTHDIIVNDNTTTNNDNNNHDIDNDTY